MQQTIEGQVLRLVSFILFGLFVFSLNAHGAGTSKSAKHMSLASDQVLNEKSFQNQQIFNQWGCTGKNISPELHWKNAPKGTKSYAVTMYDPNAPTGSGWWHWVVINIPGNIQSLELNSGAEGGRRLPQGASMLRNDFGFKGYGGACPPPNAAPHNYHITVYALDIPKLGVNDNVSPAMAGYYIFQHTLDKAVLTAPTNAR